MFNEAVSGAPSNGAQNLAAAVQKGVIEEIAEKIERLPNNSLSASWITNMTRGSVLSGPVGNDDSVFGAIAMAINGEESPKTIRQITEIIGFSNPSAACEMARWVGCASRGANVAPSVIASRLREVATW